MDYFMTMLVIGIVVMVVCYTIIQILDAVTKYMEEQRYKTVQGLTPGRLYEKSNNPPPPPIKLSANEEPSRYIANEELRRFGKVTNQIGVYTGKVIADKSPNRIVNQCDDINHPSHYNKGKIEVIDFIEDQGLSFHLGNVIKYIARAGSKGDKLEDLKKARWYLDRYINEVMK